MISPLASELGGGCQETLRLVDDCVLHLMVVGAADGSRGDGRLLLQQHSGNKNPSILYTGDHRTPLIYIIIYVIVCSVVCIFVCSVVCIFVISVVCSVVCIIVLHYVMQYL